ncbi:hypothetical protein OS493_037025 [Desmophyllum pertusum]|uniref:Uncharacterized protein n=1 Tax=Desmophyllum pertusum TaxID=174260 RepID=A0A9X0CDM4_9CNID|nr:hypothetical protein OS493_037025 [Desmophyllum pertusum]
MFTSTQDYANCQDEFVSCKTRASKGECTTRPAWMKLNCKRSCNACPPVDGQWSRWSDWKSCSKTCDNGVRTRVRKCDNPAPAYGGKTCPGNASDQSICIMKRCHLDADDTDFESFRMGMWSRHSRVNGFDWQFKNGFTQTMNTGPMEDHTTGSGYYMYLESSMPRKAGQKADLISPWMSAKPEGQCLKFYYTMYGRTMGSLDVKLELKHNGKISAWLIFLKKGGQGKDWKKGIGNINVSNRLILSACH